MIKKIIKVYIWFITFLIIYFPYKALNYFVIQPIFGNEVGKFNANSVTIFFGVGLFIISIAMFSYLYIKEFTLKTTKDKVLFIISMAILVTISIFMLKLFVTNNYWEGLIVQ